MEVELLVPIIVLSILALEFLICVSILIYKYKLQISKGFSHTRLQRLFLRAVIGLCITRLLQFISWIITDPFIVIISTGLAFNFGLILYLLLGYYWYYTKQVNFISSLHLLYFSNFKGKNTEIVWVFGRLHQYNFIYDIYCYHYIRVPTYLIPGLM